MVACFREMDQFDAPARRPEFSWQPVIDMDEALRHVGGFGNYQRLMGWLLLLPGALPVGVYMLAILLQVTDRGDHWCIIPELEDSVINETVANRISIPLLRDKNGTLVFSSCLMYDNNYTRQGHHRQMGLSTWMTSDVGPVVAKWPMTPCRHVLKHDTSKVASLMAQYGLVCEQSRLASALVAAVGTGAAVGQLVAFSCTNRAGRRWTFLLFLLLFLGLGAGSVGCRQPLCLLLTGGGATAAAAALGFNQINLVLDLTIACDHHLCHVIERLVTSGGVLLLAVVALLTRQWQTLLYASTLPLATFLIYWCAMPESPAWLRRCGRFPELCRLLQRMARVNGRTVDAEYLIDQIRNSEDDVSFTMEDLLFSNRMQRRIGSLLFLVFLTSVTYHGVAALALARSPAPQRALVLHALAQPLAVLLAWALTQTLGRRAVLLGSVSLTAVACSLTAWLGSAAAAAPWPALDSLHCLLVLLSELTLLTLLLTACGLLPSRLSAHGLLLVRMAHALGFCAQPVLTLLESKLWSFALLAVLHFVGALTCLLLPETLNEPRPRTPSDSHKVRWPLGRFRPRQTLSSGRRFSGMAAVGDGGPSPILRMMPKHETIDLRSCQCSAESELVLLGVPEPPCVQRNHAQAYITVL